MFNRIVFLMACLVGGTVFLFLGAVHIAAAAAVVFSGLVFVVFAVASMGAHAAPAGWMIFSVSVGLLCLLYEMTGIMSSVGSPPRR